MTLTPEQIRVMEAGPELNRLVSALMGWEAKHDATRCDGTRFTRCGACGGSGHGNCYGDGTGQVQIRCGEHTACCEDAEEPDWSTDIAAAWRVVEKYENIDIDNEDGRWLTIIYHATTPATTGVADTAPLAICRASLLASLENALSEQHARPLIDPDRERLFGSH